ncbi:PQQ-dependent sugar dehydrogenase [Haladaptatus caseinilyticus]|uniref:PQQ-dependent sugar dehydrogenase n=1 Tax=Haladaptatus caseinilyticus TaxID=2993314 RepID=UPI00224ACDF1|nr:PQQ-dependent sugar dehydrogenase [Haladaptatus caseinilyticus]
MKRRGFLETVFGGVTAGIIGSKQSVAATAQIRPDNTSGTDGRNVNDRIKPISVSLKTLASGMQAPIDVAFAPDADRRYIADQDGRIYVHESNGLRDKLFLDLRDAIEFEGEKGLLGIALHPDFAKNRRLFVRYSAPRRPGTPADYSHTFVLASFTANPDGTQALRDSERPVLEIPEPASNHNGGCIRFGPDGYLYVAVGDGGGSGGGIGVQSTGQNVTEDLLGSILRIDVDGRDTSTEYTIPEDNPLVGTSGRDEYYAWGFRNPWRMSFDGSDLFVGDVGESQYEEVDLVVNGGNYGWKIKEGTDCLEDGCSDTVPTNVRGDEHLIDPIIEYPHFGRDVSGVSVIGGYVYRGSDFPLLNGTYIFGDYLANGRLFAATRSEDGGMWPTELVEVADEDKSKLDLILSFGRDNDGEVYVLAIGTDGGGFHRLTPP